MAKRSRKPNGELRRGLKAALEAVGPDTAGAVQERVRALAAFEDAVLVERLLAPGPGVPLYRLANRYGLAKSTAEALERKVYRRAATVLRHAHANAADRRLKAEMGPIGVDQGCDGYCPVAVEPLPDMDDF